VLNRIDELDPSDVAALEKLLEGETPGTPILRLSAKTGDGFEALLEMLDKKGIFGHRILDLDYDIYAEGEAELGWLNSTIQVIADTEFSLDDLLLGVITRLKDKLATADAETAHLKTIGLWEGFHGVANLVSSDSEPELSLPSNCKTKSADVVVNARVAVSPELLREFVEAAVREACNSVGAEPDFRQTQSFRPGRPVPTHRYSQAYDGK
jgi:hypothetical protein